MKTQKFDLLAKSENKMAGASVYWFADLHLPGAYGPLLFTNNGCDCSSPIGGINHTAAELTDADGAALQEYVNFIKRLQTLPNAEYLVLLKHWADNPPFGIEDVLRNEIVFADDITCDFLATIEDDVLYKILLKSEAEHL
ncbi:MAG: hypothetical protein LBS36_03315 [Oscillospiraceae bacterium]|jgi:hypothetical protein|nr:hypothetical protein [Oscillospiraceae bacterium]